MIEVTKRYSDVKENFPRKFEVILLQGTGCKWPKCTFCDYYYDSSVDPFEINRPAIDMVTGKYGELDIINSGSAMELDEQTIEYLVKKVKECGIKILWLEAHWIYRNILNKFAEKFEGVDVKWRTGVETFNTTLRNKWCKGVPESVTPEEIAKYFQAVCLMVGVRGQTFYDVVSDIEIATRYFEHFRMSVFVLNSKKEMLDEELVERFKNEIYPKLKYNPKAETLLHNTDLGVG